MIQCTDWFITFSQLGKGDVPRAIAITPLNLVLQLILLPLYLWLRCAEPGLMGLGHAGSRRVDRAGSLGRGGAG